MDTLMLIRSGIFLTASLALLIFTKQISRWQYNVINGFVKKHKIKYKPSSVKSNIRTNLVLGIVFLLTSIILFFYASSL